MKKYHVLHNPLAGHGKVKKEKETLGALYGEDNLVYTDMTELVDYQAYFAALPECSHSKSGSDYSRLAKEYK